jgi:hypothetical protein
MRALISTDWLNNQAAERVVLAAGLSSIVLRTDFDWLESFESLPSSVMEIHPRNSYPQSDAPPLNCDPPYLMRPVGAQKQEAPNAAELRDTRAIAARKHFSSKRTPLTFPNYVVYLLVRAQLRWAPQESIAIADDATPHQL